ncbi:hypothetical protein GLOTRDRAFT_100985 [Gloeophyllum trabeum ATCC 11539]|uniref:Uncharacterized protein n=1 Tax=Gloeophyllum trabeum (strain ATCC 11539 / FP-39264 / Madison 617) TaxID=670483 RepID=S7PY31_GLOTA|nr:uncharacterized protein GLOTRDRAFT_100985 [Gloeophyllum trabeum ATCC 11539]EPQ52531.1 hypothetical protein GLOTRDRAFT_100985 [Gloeophyllum trabeum ATCC 11539]
MSIRPSQPGYRYPQLCRYQVCPLCRGINPSGAPSSSSADLILSLYALPQQCVPTTVNHDETGRACLPTTYVSYVHARRYRRGMPRPLIDIITSGMTS